MRHRPARRLLAQLLDETLPAGVERQVRDHLGGCRRCQRALAELELCDHLVARLPHGLFRVVGPAAGEQRLEGLASWAFARRARERHRLAAEGFAAALAAGALAGVVAFAGAVGWVPAPAPGPASSLAQVAYVMPGVQR